MKHFKKYALSLSGALVVMLAPLVPASAALAAGNGGVDFTLSPASGSYNPGDSVAVGVYEDSGSDSIVVVQTNFTYSGNLTYVSTVDGSAFTTDAQTTGGGGVIKIGRAVQAGTSGVTGKNLVATLYFTAASSGAASLSFDSGTGAWHGGDSSAATITTQDGSYTVNTPSQPSGSGSTNGGGSSSSSSSNKNSSSGSNKSSSSSPSISNSAPTVVSTTNFGGQSLTISNITVTNLSGYSATINWKTSAPAQSQVSYGQAPDQLFFSASDNTLTTNHSVKLAKSNLLAGQTYHFVVKSADAAGNVATSGDMTFKTVAPPAAAKKHSSQNAIIVAIVVALGVATFVVLLKLRQMHHASKELDHHFLTGDPLKAPAPAAPGATTSGQVIAPHNNKNTPPTVTGPGQT